MSMNMPTPMIAFSDFRTQTKSDGEAFISQRDFTSVLRDKLGSTVDQQELSGLLAPFQGDTVDFSAITDLVGSGEARTDLVARRLFQEIQKSDNGRFGSKLTETEFNLALGDEDSDIDEDADTGSAVADFDGFAKKIGGYNERINPAEFESFLDKIMGAEGVSDDGEVEGLIKALGLEGEGAEKMREMEANGELTKDAFLDAFADAFEDGAMTADGFQSALDSLLGMGAPQPIEITGDYQRLLDRAAGYNGKLNKAEFEGMLDNILGAEGVADDGEEEGLIDIMGLVGEAAEALRTMAAAGQLTKAAIMDAFGDLLADDDLSEEDFTTGLQKLFEAAGIFAGDVGAADEDADVGGTGSTGGMGSIGGGALPNLGSIESKLDEIIALFKMLKQTA